MEIERKETHETIACFRCGEDFKRAKRGRNPYVTRCPTCRRRGYRENSKKLMAKLRAETKDPYAGQSQPMTLIDFEACKDRNESGLQIVEDRQPRHYLSPAGPDHGCSTFSKDLRNTLNMLSALAEKDTWWSENPYWNDGL